MPRPSTSKNQPSSSFLFLPHEPQSTASRDEQLRRRSRRHVMHHFLARTKSGQSSGRVSPPSPSCDMHKFMHKFKLETDLKIPRGDDPSCSLPDPQATCIRIGRFDPFDSLATDEPSDTQRIIRTVYEPTATAKPFMSWVHAWFSRIRVLFWSFAMGDAAFYHVLGLQAAALSQDSEYYFHKVRALRHFRESLDHALMAAKTGIGSPPATVLITALFLFQTTHKGEMEEAHSHMAALECMVTEDLMDRLDPAGWFCINSVMLNYAFAAGRSPPLPHHVPPACRLPQNLDTAILTSSWRRAVHVASHFPAPAIKGLDSAVLQDIFQLSFIMHALTNDPEHYEQVYGLNYDLKYRLMSILAMVGKQTPLGFSYLLLVSLHCWIFMFGQNQMHDRNDDGIDRLLATSREVLQTFDMELFQDAESAKPLIWVLICITAYSLYTLRQPVELSEALYPVLQDSCGRAGVDTEAQLKDLMTTFSGDGLWPDESISLVWRQIRRSSCGAAS